MNQLAPEQKPTVFSADPEAVLSFLRRNLRHDAPFEDLLKEILPEYSLGICESRRTQQRMSAESMA